MDDLCYAIEDVESGAKGSQAAGKCFKENYEYKISREKCIEKLKHDDQSSQFNLSDSNSEKQLDTSMESSSSQEKSKSGCIDLDTKANGQKFNTSPKCAESLKNLFIRSMNIGCDDERNVANDLSLVQSQMCDFSTSKEDTSFFTNTTTASNSHMNSSNSSGDEICFNFINDKKLVNKNMALDSRKDLLNNFIPQNSFSGHNSLQKKIEANVHQINQKNSNFNPNYISQRNQLPMPIYSPTHSHPSQFTHNAPPIFFPQAPIFNNFPIDNVNCIQNPLQIVYTRSSGTKPCRYSRKVFVGGLPSDASEADITFCFARFGMHSVDWPYRKVDGSCYPPKGYCFLLFNNEVSVRELIKSCLSEKDRYYWYFSSQTVRNKIIQIRPWLMEGSEYIAKEILDDCGIKSNQKSALYNLPSGFGPHPAQNLSKLLHPRRMVFIGGIPRPTQAKVLAESLEQYFGKVLYVGIDTDSEFHYPKGSGKILFKNTIHRNQALKERFAVININNHFKRVEIKPYLLENQPCDICKYVAPQADNDFEVPKNISFNQVRSSNVHSTGPNNSKKMPLVLFCSSTNCLKYYCTSCWQNVHQCCPTSMLNEHKPMIKDFSRSDTANKNLMIEMNNIWLQSQNNLTENIQNYQNIENSEFCRFDSSLEMSNDSNKQHDRFEKNPNSQN